MFTTNKRVLAIIVNIASDIAQQHIATPADIDAAVILGLGYPQGPLALADLIGLVQLAHRGASYPTRLMSSPLPPPRRARTGAGS